MSKDSRDGMDGNSCTNQDFNMGKETRYRSK